MSARKTWQAGLVTCILALPAGMAGCASGSEEVPPARPTVALGDRDVIGRTVTVSGKIISILTSESFVMAADRFGDLSLLVLSDGRPGLAKGQTLTFDGNVQVFTYEAYRRQYDLAERQAYGPFEGEKAIVMARSAPAGRRTATVRASVVR